MYLGVMAEPWSGLKEGESVPDFMTTQYIEPKTATSFLDLTCKVSPKTRKHNWIRASWVSTVNVLYYRVNYTDHLNELDDPLRAVYINPELPAEQRALVMEGL